jgi:hypothetical protein
MSDLATAAIVLLLLAFAPWMATVVADRTVERFREDWGHDRPSPAVDQLEARPRATG